MQDQIIEHIRQVAKILPKKQASICEYICDHPMEVSALNAAELAEHLHVGTATVTRLIGRLGFQNYPDFRKALRRASVLPAKDAYSTYWDARLQLLSARSNDSHSTYQTVLEQITDWTQELCTPDFFAALDQGVELILKARKVGVIGLRSARALALTFTYSLHNSMNNIIPLCEDSEYAIDTVAEMDCNDLVIIYATFPYVQKTGEIARICQKLGIPMLLITTKSQEMHPLSQSATLTLTAGESSSIPTYIPQLLITELLTKQLNILRADRSTDMLKKLDAILAENNLKIWELN